MYVHTYILSASLVDLLHLPYVAFINDMSPSFSFMAGRDEAFPKFLSSLVSTLISCASSMCCAVAGHSAPLSVLAPNGPS